MGHYFGFHSCTAIGLRRYIVLALINLFVIGGSSLTASASSLAPSLEAQSKIPQSNSGADILYAIDSAKVSSVSSSEITRYISIRINDEEAARDYGQIKIYYNNFYSDLHLDFARVKASSGELIEVSKSAIQRKSPDLKNYYRDQEVIVFAPPKITPGAIIEFQFTQTRFQNPIEGILSLGSMTYWYQEQSDGLGGRLDPVHRSMFEVSVPKDIQIHHELVGPHTPKYKNTSLGPDKVIHKWSWQNLPSVKIESGMPDYGELATYMQVSTSKNWSDVDAWLNQINHFSIMATQQVKEIALGLTNEGFSRNESIKAVYQYIQDNIRYVYAHVGRGGYQAHKASDVLNHGYGDCKDQSMLAISLLQAMGIPAYPVLLNTNTSQTSPQEVVGPYFDHMIFAAEDDNGELLFVDTTGIRSLYPGVSNQLQGASLFVLDGKGGYFTSLDQQLSKNTAKLRLNFVIEEEEPLTVDLIAELSGVFEQSTRHLWIESSQRDLYLQQILSSLFPGPYESQPVSEVVNTEELFQPASIRAKFRFPAPEMVTEKERVDSSIIQAMRFFGFGSDLQPVDTRENRFVTRLPFQIEQEVVINVKDDHQLTLIKGADNIDHDFYQIDQSASKIDGGYKVEIAFFQGFLDLNKKEYKRYIEQLENVQKEGLWSFILSKKSKSDSEILSSAFNETSSLNEQLKLLRQFLERGAYVKALLPAKKIVEHNPNNGEAWYLLGVIQGYNALMTDSRRSFNEAKRLGYEPF